MSSTLRSFLTTRHAQPQRSKLSGMTRTARTAVLLASVLSAGWNGWAQDHEFTRKTLRGLTGVAVMVEQLDPEVERDGLARSQLQTDAELKLRLAGIKVLEQTATTTTLAPYLYINVNFMPSGGQYVFFVGVELKQTVMLTQRFEPATATTWSSGYLGIVGARNVHQVRDAVKDYVTGSSTPTSLSIQGQPLSSENARKWPLRCIKSRLYLGFSELLRGCAMRGRQDQPIGSILDADISGTWRSKGFSWPEGLPACGNLWALVSWQIGAGRKAGPQMVVAAREQRIGQERNVRNHRRRSAFRGHRDLTGATLEGGSKCLLSRDWGACCNDRTGRGDSCSDSPSWR